MTHTRTYVVPTIGRIVIYRSRTGDYDIPAIITATIKTLSPLGVELGHVPPLSSDEHIHLTVFTPGKPGTSRGDNSFMVESGEPVSQNFSGCYQEWDIPPDGFRGESLTPNPGTWRWPECV